MTKRRTHRRAARPTHADKVAPGVNKSDSSDDEPLIKRAKKTPKAAKKVNFVPPKKSADTREGSKSGDGSDDEPLSNLAKKLNSKPQTELHIVPSKGAKSSKRPRKERSVKMNMVKFNEASSDSSDDTPLAEIKQKVTKADEAQRTTAKRQTTKHKEESLKGVNKSDSSDDEPLIKRAKKTPKAAKKVNFVPPKKSADTREGSKSGDSSEDEPLSHLAKKLNSKPQTELPIIPSEGAKSSKRPRKKRSVKMNIVKYNEASSDSSDDTPLAEIKQKVTKADEAQRTTAKRQTTKHKEESLKAKKPVKEINSSNTSTNTSDKKAGVNKSDSSDDEPLIKRAKKTPKAARKVKKSADTTTEESTSGDSSDNEPLSEMVKKLRSTPQRELQILLSKGSNQPIRPRKERSAKMNMVKYNETSSDSDDTPLAEMKQKVTKADEAQRTTAKTKKVKRKEVSPKESSSDDDVPLAYLAAEKKPTRESTNTALQVSTPRKKQGPDCDSSDDEPLIHILKKKPTENRITTKKETTIFENVTQTCISGISGKGSFKMLNEAVRHPQVTKMVKIILERCTWDYNENKASTD